MKIVMTLVVKNEESIIKETLDYYFAQGVDIVIVTDNGSTDKTLEIIEPYVKSGDVHLIHEPARFFFQSKWVTHMARLAHEKYNADWIIHCDADEFWMPQSGDFKSTLEKISPKYGILRVNRCNFIPPVNEGEKFYANMIIRETSSYNIFFDKDLLPKVCHRGSSNILVGKGNHKVKAKELGETLHTDSFLIFHYPLRTYEQFEKKVVKGGEAYKNNESQVRTHFFWKLLLFMKRKFRLKHKELRKKMDVGIGPFWLELFKIYQKGELKKYYQNKMLGQDVIARHLKDGKLLVDTRLKDFVTKLNENQKISS